jgi:hypothetical protein
VFGGHVVVVTGTGSFKAAIAVGYGGRCRSSRELKVVMLHPLGRSRRRRWSNISREKVKVANMMVER